LPDTEIISLYWSQDIKSVDPVTTKMLLCRNQQKWK